MCKPRIIWLWGLKIVFSKCLCCFKLSLLTIFIYFGLSPARFYQINLATKKQLKTRQAARTPIKKKARVKRQYPLLPWLLFIGAVTAICFFPMLFNEFTNWDDEYYVGKNQMLRGPDLGAIFTTQVLGNYHPLTILSYAFNYAISGLHPFSYLLVNYLFHIAFFFCFL